MIMRSVDPNVRNGFCVISSQESRTILRKQFISRVSWKTKRNLVKVWAVIRQKMGRVETVNIQKPKNKISHLPDGQQISRERPIIVQHTSLILEKPIIASSTKTLGTVIRRSWLYDWVKRMKLLASIFRFYTLLIEQLRTPLLRATSWFFPPMQMIRIFLI